MGKYVVETETTIIRTIEVEAIDSLAALTQSASRHYNHMNANSEFENITSFKQTIISQTK